MSLQEEEAAFHASAEAGVIHRSASPYYNNTDDKVYFPANYRAVKDLLGKVLTQLDAMTLPDRAHKAARTLLTREVWRWWYEVCLNAATSYLGDIAPIVTGGPYVKDGPSNRWGWQSEAAWLAVQPEPGDYDSVKPRAE